MCIKFNVCVCDKLQLHTNKNDETQNVEKTLKSAEKMTNGNDVTHHNTKHTILIHKTKITPYSVPPAHAPASVWLVCRYVLGKSVPIPPLIAFQFPRAPTT